MGLSLTNTHIHNLANLTKPQFKKALTDMMKAKGYTKVSEDDASVSLSLVFTKDRKWVTVLGEDINTSDLAKSLSLQVLSVELVDSDFAEIKLHSADSVDTLMLGRPYMEEYPDPNPDKWQSILGESTWSQVEEIQSGDHTFAEDALAEFGALVGLGENILLESDDIPEGAEILHFKKAKEKKLTLNAAFKQVFGPELEKQGFVRAKTKYPYYVRKVNEDIFHIITVKNEPSVLFGYKNFTLLGAVTTLYRKDLNLSSSVSNYTNMYRDLYHFYSCATWPDNDYIDFSRSNYNDENINEIFNGMLELTKKYMLPVLDKVKDIKSLFSYYLEHDQRSTWLLNRIMKFNNEYLTDTYVFLKYYDEKIIDKYSEHKLSALESGKIEGLNIEYEKKSILEYRQRLRDQHLYLQEHKELYNEIEKIMEERKKVNKAIMDMYV